MPEEGIRDVGDRVANYVTVFDDRLRNAFKSPSSGLVAMPLVVFGGLFGATIIGAISFRRSAQRLSRRLPPPQMHAPPAQGTVEEMFEAPPKALEVLTKGEIAKLFIIPGIIAGASAFALGKMCQSMLDIDTVEDFVRQLRWLFGGGARPQRVCEEKLNTKVSAVE